MNSKFTIRKPDWLRKKINPSAHQPMQSLLNDAHLHTVCEAAMCPNISECYRAKQATFLILGTICTRACTFCAVTKGHPSAIDPDEPESVARAVKTLALRHVVITSPTRDDLQDGGAAHFCKTVSAVKQANPSCNVELLIPDLRENSEALEQIAYSGADIIGHNLETVPRLYQIRKGAQYDRSLRVLKALSGFNPKPATKSGIMLGLGEEDNEVLALMRDLLDAGCRLLSIGQYLAPSTQHTPVIEFVPPERFEYFRIRGMEMGFTYIKSSPYTRSSYLAGEYLDDKNV